MVRAVGDEHVTPVVDGDAVRRVERRLGGPRATAYGLIAGAVAMAAADTRPQERGPGDAGATDGLALGVAQASALMPGVSRNGATLTAAVGQLPFNFQIGDDVKKIELLPPSTPEGELVVFAGGCAGAPIASLPLAPAIARQDVTVLPAVKLQPRAGGPSDLCFRFTQRTVDPMWAVQWIEVRP